MNLFLQEGTVISSTEISHRMANGTQLTSPKRVSSSMFRSSPGDLAKQSYRMFDSEYMHPHQAS